MNSVYVNRRIKRDSSNLSLYIGLFFIVIFSLLFLMSFVYPIDPLKHDLSNRFSGINSSNLLGTDQFGRDILSRIMFSTRSVFTVGIGSVMFGTVIGTIIGLSAGIVKRPFNRILMSIVDGLQAFPGVLLAMLVVFIMGRGIMSTIIAIGIMMIPIFARLSYSTVLEVKPNLYIRAAQSYGLETYKIVIRHIFPTVLPKLITQLTSSIASAILMESSLSFLGLGVQPPNASLGLMVNEAQSNILAHPYQMFPPGIVLTIVVLGFIFVGDALNDRLLAERGED